MPKPYIKKVKVVYKKQFERLGIDPAKLSLSQRNYTDKLFTVYSTIRTRNEDYADLHDEVILEFVERTNGKNKDFVRNLFRTYTNTTCPNELEDRVPRGLKHRRFYLLDNDLDEQLGEHINKGLDKLKRKKK